MPVSAPAVAQPRLHGADRWATAAELARATAAGRLGGVQHALLANGDADRAGADALSASHLAGALQAPVVLTSASGLPPSTLGVLQELFGPAPVTGATLHVVGGAAAVPAAQADALGAALPGVAVTRTEGADRYETARLLAAAGAALRPVGLHTADDAVGPLRTVLLANGTSPVDALIAGPVAHAGGYPLLLTAAGSLPAATAAALAELGAQQVLVLGGPTAVSDAVVAALTGSGHRVMRVAGADRYETAAALLTLASAPPGGTASRPGGLGLGFASATSAYLISGLAVIDAIAAAPLAGSTLRPLLPTTPGELAPATGTWLGGSEVTSVTGVGGAAVLAEDLLVATNAVLGAPL